MSDYFLQIELSPESLELLRSMPQRAAAALPAMAKALDLQNDLTVGYAQKNKLSGPRPGVLGVVTNRLRGSLRRTDATISGQSIEGAIGSNVVYAAVHEYGFDGEVTVQPFTRRRRTIRVGKRSKITTHQVRSFTRHMRMPERSFIRSSISERLENYNEALSAAVVAALGGAT